MISELSRIKCNRCGQRGKWVRFHSYPGSVQVWHCGCAYQKLFAEPYKKETATHDEMVNILSQRTM